MTQKKLPPIGARIIKSSVGSMICILIYWLRLQLPIGEGIPFYSILAVLWCVQPYTTSTLAMAQQRTLGTLIGAAYGLVFLLVMEQFTGIPRVMTHFTACLMLIPILYTTVLINKRNASYFSCVVFLTVSINHIADANPYLFVLNRVLDTEIGIGVGVLMNVIHLPVRAGQQTLYVSGIDSVLVSSKDTMIPYNKVELNRMIAQGLKFTVSTIRTPASMLDVLNGVNLNLPVVAMDGAVLYDLKENRYIEVVPLSSADADTAEALIEQEGFHVFVNALLDNTLHIYYGDLKNEPEANMLQRLRRSPYRNYTQKSFRLNGELEKVLYLMVLLPTDQAERVQQKLYDAIGDTIRVTLSPATEYEGYTYMKIYNRDATREKMICRLKNKIFADKVITIGSIPGKYDVLVSDDGGNSAVKAMKRMFCHL